MRKLTGRIIADSQIRELHNGFVEGTATDAIGRHLCHVALGECCIGTDNPVMPFRYPTEAERREARNRLADHWNSRHAPRPRKAAKGVARG